MTRWILKLCVAVMLLPCVLAYGSEDKPYWEDAMKEVHAKFEGDSGYVAQFGDSITYSMAFWSSLDYRDPSPFMLGDDGFPNSPDGKRWRDVIKGARDKGESNGNYSRWKIDNVLGVIDQVLSNRQPEVAIIMIGSNDMRADEPYRVGLETIVQKCIAVNCVPIISTIPPRRGRDDVVAQINAVIKETAVKYKIPLVDFHAEILKRQPGTAWDGTLISKDGVHPSGGKSDDFSEANLKINGYALRTWVTWLMFRQVYFRILSAGR
jgi:lysophospholipase L1-like esterase